MLHKPLYRRSFLMTLAGGIGIYTLAAAVVDKTSGGKVRIAQFDAAGKRTGVVEVDKVVKSDGNGKSSSQPSSSM